MKEYSYTCTHGIRTGNQTSVYSNQEQGLGKTESNSQLSVDVMKLFCFKSRENVIIKSL